MELRELVETILAGDLIHARQWVSDAYRCNIDWRMLERPTGSSTLEVAVAAAMAELLADRAGSPPPSWTSEVGGTAEPTVLDPGLESMPRSFMFAKSHGPLPLRKRNLIALPDFLLVA